MQHFDDEIEKLIRAGVIDLETGLNFSTNPGNLRLELSDLLDNDGEMVDAQPFNESSLSGAEMEIER